MQRKGYLQNSNERKYLELLSGDIVNINDSKTNNFSFDKINFDLSDYTSKSTTFPKIQELNSKLLIKCLVYDAKGKAKDLKSEIFICGKSTIKSVKEEVFKRFYKPLYLLLLTMIACLIFFISKENKRFRLYKYIIFFYWHCYNYPI